ncbi:MAG: endonuclease III [Nanoarchaeota archaeon]|nr:endonuclease III [Nanoarchaeota archaeon]
MVLSTREKARILTEFLEKRYANVTYPRSTPFHVLIRTIISQRNRDELTDEIFERNFSSFHHPSDIAGLSEKELMHLLKPAGLYRQKAKAILKTCKILSERYNDEIPRTREELMALPGVGGKTADIVLSYGFGEDVVACDTHVIWISNAIGIVKSTDPDIVRENLMELIPPGHRKMFNIRAVAFGKEICVTSRPHCELCELNKICDYFRSNFLKKHKNKEKNNIA